MRTQFDFSTKCIDIRLSIAFGYLRVEGAVAAFANTKWNVDIYHFSKIGNRGWILCVIYFTKKASNNSLRLLLLVAGTRIELVTSGL